jgi:hypothetical protein
MALTFLATWQTHSKSMRASSHRFIIIFFFFFFWQSGCAGSSSKATGIKLEVTYV